jgi:hypothetical protein
MRQYDYMPESTNAYFSGRITCLCRNLTSAAALLAAGPIMLAGGSINFASAQSPTCTDKVASFVKDLDPILDMNPNSVRVVIGVVKKYFPTEGCEIDEVIEASKHSRYFVEAYEQYAFYTVIFKSKHYSVTFGLRKDGGKIEYPAAMPILPSAPRDQNRKKLN